MLPEERALLAAIIADPDDDTCRLAYADWLDEHDRPERAELIRVQIALARTKRESDPENRRNAWHSRLRLLLAAHSVRWRRELPKIPRVTWGPFERGMVESIQLSLGTFPTEDFTKLDQVFGITPLRVLRVDLGQWLRNYSTGCAAFLNWPGLVRFEELHISGAKYWYRAEGDPRPACFAPLWTHAWGARPRLVSLRECELDDGTLRGLAERPAENPIPTFDIRGAWLSPELRTVLLGKFGTRIRLD